MISRLLLSAYTIVLFLAIGLTFFTSCKFGKEDATKSSIAFRDSLIQKYLRVTLHAADSVAKTLKTGEIALRMGRSTESVMLAQFSLYDKSFSHCGIVIVEFGYPFVYHCIGGEDKKEEKLRRDSAKFFFSPLNSSTIGIADYNLDDSKQEELKNIVKDWYIAQPAFDLNFDLKTDGELYCSEFVYKVFNTLMHDTGYIKTTSLMGYRFVSLENVSVNEHSQLICKTNFDNFVL